MDHMFLIRIFGPGKQTKYFNILVWLDQKYIRGTNDAVTAHTHAGLLTQPGVLTVVMDIFSEVVYLLRMLVFLADHGSKSSASTFASS